MNTVFVKPKYLKSTKLQNGIKFPEVLNLGNFEEPDLVGVERVDLLEYGKLCWSLIRQNENPLGDFLREKVKLVRQIVIDENYREPIFIRSNNLVHNLIVVKAGVKAQIVFNGENNCMLGAEIFVETGAEVKIVLMQTNCKDFNFSVIRACLEREAKVEWYLNYFSSDQAYSYVKSDLIGERAVSNVNVCAYTKGTELVDLFVGNCFDAPYCEGEILAKTVGADKSKLAFVGEIDITLQGGGTDSYLKEEVLMLDDSVKIDAVPSLEIKTNDVKAGHGVAISKLNEERLFYLTSRGIDTDEARKLVLQGFLRDVFSKIGIQDVVDRLNKLVD